MLHLSNSNSNVNIWNVIVEHFNYLDYETTKQWYRIAEAIEKIDYKQNMLSST